MIKVAGIRDKYLQITEVKFLRFMIAGLLNSIFGFSIYTLFIYLKTPLWVALLLGMILGTIFNFYTTAGYVFRQLSVNKIPRFIFLYLMIYLINLALIKIILTFMAGEIIAQAILTTPMAIFSFLSMKKFVFISD